MIEPGQQLYHGTAHRFGLGGQVNPGHPSNYPGVTNDVDAERVYATTDIAGAYSHARNASDKMNEGKTVWKRGFSPEDTGEPNGLGRPVYRPSAPRVYPVKNQGSLQYDDEFDTNEYDPGEIEAYQSYSPMDVTGRDVGAQAGAEFKDTYGYDYGRAGIGQGGNVVAHWNSPLNVQQFRPTQVGDL